jgi:DNA-binding response OmpR family regulator
MSPKRSILIVEDDEHVRTMLAEELAEDGFAVSTAGTLDQTEAIVNDDDRYFDAVILDIGMPDGDGRDCCAKLRRQGHNMPVIMLTGSDAEADIVRGLDSGANDYIAKPFRISELLARLRAQLREFEISVDAVFKIGPFVFRPSKRLLQNSATNRRIRLTEKEAAVLKFLYRSGARAVNRPELLREVWGYDSRVATHTLETHIYRLRQKMEADPAFPSLLLTEGGGYRLDPEMTPAGESLRRVRGLGTFHDGRKNSGRRARDRSAVFCCPEPADATDDKLISTYLEARDAYEAAKAGTNRRIETFTMLLVAETVLRARLGWVDQKLQHFREHYSP